MPKEEFKHEVEKHLTGKETEPWEILYFKVYKSQLPVIEQALETAALMLGTDKSRWLLPGDDRRRFSGGSEPGSWSGEHIIFGARSTDQRSPRGAETAIAGCCEERP